MYYLSIMAIVNCIEELNEQVISLALGETPLRLVFPQLVEFATFQQLHFNNKLVLARERKVIAELHNVPVTKLRQGLNFFGNHMTFLMIIKV